MINDHSISEVFDGFIRILALRYDLIFFPLKKMVQSIYYPNSQTKQSMTSVTILPVCGGKHDFENLVSSAHKQLWRPLAANVSFYDS